MGLCFVFALTLSPPSDRWFVLLRLLQTFFRLINTIVEKFVDTLLDSLMILFSVVIFDAYARCYVDVAQHAEHHLTFRLITNDFASIASS